MGTSVMVPIKARMNTTARMGTDRGSRISRNACHGVAPSMAAASSKEESMVSK